ncbi:prepilin-type N-terminal cleavage/methylation domain-containing protein [Lysinibacillus sp. FSL K6-0075]|uniref:prepilin-type N-terminal cleavage/methylation domain-containing protein n=1 Tax=Lysinibacillus sp. FSL K6-0075 TaxID=2921415 RepID=UPI003158D052
MVKKWKNTKLLKNEKGLTLIELLAVIVILAIIAAIAVPAIGSIIDNSRYKAAKSDAIMALNSANIYFTDTPTDDKGAEITEVDLDTLIEEGYLETEGTLDDDIKINKASGGATTISGTAKAGKYTITFSSAKQDDISNDNQKVKKDSKDGAITVSGKTP